MNPEPDINIHFDGSISLVMTNNKELVNRTRDHNWWVFGHWRLVGFDSSKKMYEGGSLSALDIKQEWCLNWQDLWTRIFVIVLSNILIIIEIGLEYVAKVEIGVLPKLRDNSFDITFISTNHWVSFFIMNYVRNYKFAICVLSFNAIFLIEMVLTLNLRKIGFLKRATLTSDQSMGSSMKPNLKMEWGSFCYVKSNMYVGHMNHPLVIFKRSSHPKELLERFGLKSKICTPPRDCRGMARLNDVFSLGNSSNLSFFGPWNLVDEPRCEFLSHIILASFKSKDFFFEKASCVILIIQNAKKCFKSIYTP